MAKRYSNKLPMRKFFFLYIITQGLFVFSWFHRNWKHMKESGKKIRPGWRTACLFVPFYNIWLMYAMFRDAIKMVKVKNIRTRPALNIFLLFFLAVTIDNRLGLRLPEPWDNISYVFTLLSFLPLYWTQGYLNDYWDKTKKLPLRPGFTAGQIIWITVGILMWAIILWPLPS